MYTIKGTRKKLGMSQTEIGSLMGMSQQAITKIESGERTETQIHVRMLSMILIISQFGLLHELKDNVKLLIDMKAITG